MKMWSEDVTNVEPVPHLKVRFQTISFWFFSHEKRLLGWGLNGSFGNCTSNLKKNTTRLPCAFPWARPTLFPTHCIRQSWSGLREAQTWTSWSHCQLPVAYGLAARRESRKPLVPAKKIVQPMRHQSIGFHMYVFDYTNKKWRVCFRGDEMSKTG